MNRLRKENRFLLTLVSAQICCSWCAHFVLFVLWMFIPIVSASDFELANPAARDFIEFRSDTKNTGNFARKTPAFNERIVPTPQKAEPIRQVSAFGESTNDPFPMVANPVPLQTPAAQHYPFDWGNAPPVVPNNPLVAQNNINMIPYDPNAFGHVNPSLLTQEMQAMYLAQQQFAQQQFAQQPWQHQGYMMQIANPYTSPYVDMYAQYGYADPYGMGAYQPVPNHSAMYQAFALQAMAQQQAEEAQARGSNGQNNPGDTNATAPQVEPQWSLNNLVPVRVSSPLGETLLAGAKVMSPFSTPTGSHKGVGMPLVNTSWLDHPYYAGGFVGYVSGSELVSKMIDQKGGGTGGFTFGYNFNDYWGLESRVHLASIEIRDTDYARQLFESSYRAQFGTEAAPLLTTRTNELTILDAAVHYYPLGNSKWRPYFKYGLGVGQQRFTNTFGYENRVDIVTMPLGMGVRYWWNERLAIQADLIDNLVFASDITKAQHNVSFTVGLTYAFGSG